MSILRETRLILTSVGILWWLPLLEKSYKLLSFLSQLQSSLKALKVTWTIKVPENPDHSLKCYKKSPGSDFIQHMIFIQELQQSFNPSVMDFHGFFSWLFMKILVLCCLVCVHAYHNALLTLWVTAPAQFTRPCSIQCQEECRRRLTTSSWVAALSWFCSSEPTYGSCSQSESGGTWHLCPGKQSYITTPTLQLLGTSQYRIQMSSSKANNPQLLLKTSHFHYQSFSVSQSRTRNTWFKHCC